MMRGGHNRPPATIAFLTVTVMVLLLALSTACGQPAATTPGTPAAAVSASPAVTPPVEASTWPEALGGAWVNSKAEPSEIVISETDGRAVIEKTNAKGQLETWTFTASKMTLTFPGSPNAAFQLWRPGSTKFTGSYRVESPNGPITIKVMFGDDILVISGTAIFLSGRIIGKIDESYSTKDGLTLTHRDAGLPVKSAVYARE